MPVSVKGAVELRKALKAFTPDLAKGLTKDMAQAMKPVAKIARGYMPSDSQVLSNWGISGNKINASTSAFATNAFPKYLASAVKANVGFKSTPSKPNSRGFRSLAQLFNKSRAGAIYEVAGTKNPDSVFVKNQEFKYPSTVKGKGNRTGRGLYRAYEEDNGKAYDAVRKAIQDAKDKLNKRATVVA